MKYEEIVGDLIALTKEGRFDVIAHGVNCFCTQASGLAPKMVTAFATDKHTLEDPTLKGDINKLGQIDFELVERATGDHYQEGILNFRDPKEFVIVVNCYTQFKWADDKNPKPFDYEAFTLCMRKMNHEFKGSKIGLPLIGGHLAGGDPVRIKEIMKTEFKDCDLTLVLWSGE